MNHSKPTIAAGDVLWGHPKFNGDDSRGKLSPNAHMVLVLRVVTDPENPGRNMAMGVPISTSPVQKGNPYAIDLPHGKIKGVDMRDDISRLCCNSPVAILINGVENGLRPNPNRAEGQHHFVHGRINDPSMLDKAWKKTAEAMRAENYKPPIQGEAFTPTQRGYASARVDHGPYARDVLADRQRQILGVAGRLEAERRIAKHHNLEAIAAQRARVAAQQKTAQHKI